jgi:hypothetical protein
MLPGLLPPLLLGSGGGFAFRSSASFRENSAQNTTAPIPPGLSVGDLFIIFYACSGSNNPTTPSGFTAAANRATSGTVGQYNAWYQTVTSVPGSVAINTSSTGSKSIVSLAYSQAAVDVVGTPGAAQGSGTSFNTTAIDTTRAGILVAAFFQDTSGVIATPPSGMTLREIQSSPSLAVYDQTQGVQSIVSRTIDWSSTADRSGSTIQIYGV